MLSWVPIKKQMKLSLVCVELKNNKNKKKDKHETFSLLLLDKRCMTSVMKVCGIILLHYSPYTWMLCVL